MKITNTEVYGFKASIRGMRNPMNSWDRSDSYTDLSEIFEESYMSSLNPEMFVLGDADKILSQKLTNAGSEHCKHLRMIQVWVDLELPRYIWSEFDTYKFNTKISCSTMHKINSRHLTENDFEGGRVAESILEELNRLIDLMNVKDQSIENKNEIRRTIKQMLPEGYLQKRTVNMNYAELLSLYHQRKNHKLKEWHEICDWIKTLPYFTDLTGIL